jgi:uncharacterized protein (DUF58 family)
MKPKAYISDLFFTNRFYGSLVVCILFFVLAFFNPAFLFLAFIVLVLFILLVLVDYCLLFFTKNNVLATRHVDNILSNGDENKITLEIKNNYNIHLKVEIIDEIPFQFQIRDFHFYKQIDSKETYQYEYTLRPTQRGEYSFGNTLLYVSSLLQLIQRRFTKPSDNMVQVYPSFVKLKQYQILGTTNQQLGDHHIKKRGASTEFDHVKEYAMGDDVRTINWKASARKNNLMINAYTDERSQQVYCIIDKSRLMKMPFDELTLLDYAINATHMLSYIALQKKDKVGLVTFDNKINDILLASKSRKTFNEISTLLYKQETNFLDSNFADLYQTVKQTIKQRSLLILFTNIETRSGLERNMQYYKAMNQKHMLCLILFENTEIQQLHNKRTNNIEDIYIKTIADKYSFEKRMIVKELQKSGIIVIYTSPQQLTVQVVNKYLDIKSKRLL